MLADDILLLLLLLLKRNGLVVLLAVTRAVSLHLLALIEGFVLVLEAQQLVNPFFFLFDVV